MKKLSDSKIDQLRAKRCEVMHKLQNLEQIRRGSMTEQYVEAVLKDGSTVRRGPYFLYSFKDKQKTISRRVTDRRQIDLYREQIENFRQFQQGTGELLSLGEQISNLAAAQSGSLKKTNSFKSKKKPK